MVLKSLVLCLLILFFLATAQSMPCGNGNVQNGEQCDDSNQVSGDGCSSSCTIETGFSCSGSPSVCTAVCGNGLRHGAEACDDGNSVGGDGCSATCQLETGFQCTSAQPAVCSPICGDSMVVGIEECDDGNSIANDGCQNCQIQLGYQCSGTPSDCAPICGDGRVIAPEECDDSNLMAQDGCSVLCFVEPGWECAGQPSICQEIPAPTTTTSSPPPPTSSSSSSSSSPETSAPDEPSSPGTASPTTPGNVGGNASSPNSNQNALIAGVVVAVVGVGLVCCCVILAFAVWYTRRSQRTQTVAPSEESLVSVSLSETPPLPTQSASSQQNRSIFASSFSTMPTLTFLQGPIKITKKIGQGIGGNVFLGKWKGCKVALKELTDPSGFENECTLLAELGHPCIVRFFGIYQEHEKYFLVLEYVPGGSLLDFLATEDLTTEELAKVCLDIAKGMKYLESKNVVHRDLAARNVLINNTSKEVKITDFGLSRQTNNATYSIQHARSLPVRWCAPEVLRQVVSTNKSDVYAFAITCWEICSKGELPFADLNNQQVVKAVLDGERPDRPSGMWDSLWPIIQQCWHADPAQRPSFSTLVSMLKDMPEIQKSALVSPRDIQPSLSGSLKRVDSYSTPNAPQSDSEEIYISGHESGSLHSNVNINPELEEYATVNNLTEVDRLSKA